MRALIYVPILHSEADLGSMAEEMRAKFVQAFGADAWARRVSAVDAMWEGIGARLYATPLRWKKVRLYQDGLPICGREEDIARRLAAAGSRNHALLLELMRRGAALMGTEDPDAMLREYHRIQALAQMARVPSEAHKVHELARAGDELLRERDAFILRRIDETLGQDETGILFIGLLHRVDELTEGKFEVRHLIHRLPLSADPWRRLKEVNRNGN